MRRPTIGRAPFFCLHIDATLRVAMGALCVATGATDALKVGCKPPTATMQDPLEPIDVTTFVAPTSDTTEPDPSV